MYISHDFKRTLTTHPCRNSFGAAEVKILGKMAEYSHSGIVKAGELVETCILASIPRFKVLVNKRSCMYEVSRYFLECIARCRAHVWLFVAAPGIRDGMDGMHCRHLVEWAHILSFDSA